MSRTRAEVRAFLDSQVGKIPQHPAPYQSLSGQCVTGVKVLLDFLGVPAPYSARGNAIDVGDTLLRQGIAREGKGWLTIVINRSMGRIFENGIWNNYGHIWTDLSGEANYESNGARALYMTKNTRPITQGQQFINLDNYIVEEGEQEVIIGNDQGWRDRMNRFHHQLVMNADISDAVWESVKGKELSRVLLQWSDHSNAQLLIAYQELGELASRDKWQQQIYDRTGERDGATKALNAANAEIRQLQQKIAELANDGASKQAIADLQAQVVEAQKKAEEAQKALNAKIDSDVATDTAVTGFLRSLWNKITGGK